jgi:hypothetical protein
VVVLKRLNTKTRVPGMRPTIYHLFLFPCCAMACRLSVHGELVGCTGMPQLSIDPDPSSYLFSMTASSSTHTCAVRYRSGKVVCWSFGGGTHPAIDAPDWVVNTTALSLGKEHSCALWGSLKTLTCWGGNVAIATAVDVSNGVRMLAVGHPEAKHVCFLRESLNQISCIGSNSKGQLGLGTAGGPIEWVPAERIRAD